MIYVSHNAFVSNADSSLMKEIHDIKQQLRQGINTLRVLSLVMAYNKNVIVKVDALMVQ